MSNEKREEAIKNIMKVTDELLEKAKTDEEKQNIIILKNMQISSLCE